MVWWRSWRNYYEDFATFTVLVTMECVVAGLNTLFKAATLEGMSYRVFMVYDYAVAALLLLPAPFFSYRSRVLPPLRFPILRKIGILAVIGISCQIMGYTGIIYSSPTLSSAISNLTPAFTFILAILFRMEKVVWNSSSSKAKVMGTIISITGAFVVTLYKGPAIFKASKPSMSLHQPLNLPRTDLVSGANLNWVIGGAFLTAQYILIPLWLIVLTQIMVEYPAELTVMFFYNLFVCFIALVVGLVVERNASAWRIGSNIALASVVCSGIFSSCLSNTVHSWALRLKGPVYVAMFKPFSIAVAFVLGIIFLADTPYLGSLIGATTISIGFYTVMWGKAKEATPEDRGSGSSSGTTIDSPSSHKVPLLQSYKTEQE
ncbi:Usually multiple acids move in and out Transporters 41 [Hibiscus trionum]|uniref:WAT1-related protein n=1 Tax=Hibiscus trionum TaxID=183268 RepID=A0A9W7MFG7_HIBTR|nr:Usually multiple acids move in and out Transporters 41 [Hibiscus trionum]